MPGPAVLIGDLPAGTSAITLDLPSSTWAPVQGEQGKIIGVRVTPVDLPPTSINEAIRVVYRERQCVQYTVRNIRLMPTLERADGTPQGHNDLLLYLAQSPDDEATSPGPVRQALVPVTFLPPATRTPDGAILEVEDEIFVRPGF